MSILNITSWMEKGTAMSEVDARAALVNEVLRTARGLRDKVLREKDQVWSQEWDALEVAFTALDGHNGGKDRAVPVGAFRTPSALVDFPEQTGRVLAADVDDMMGALREIAAGACDYDDMRQIAYGALGRLAKRGIGDGAAGSSTEPKSGPQ
jgi:hypothetical protein